MTISSLYAPAHARDEANEPPLLVEILDRLGHA